MPREGGYSREYISRSAVRQNVAPAAADGRPSGAGTPQNSLGKVLYSIVE